MKDLKRQADELLGDSEKESLEQILKHIADNSVDKQVIGEIRDLRTSIEKDGTDRQQALEKISALVKENKIDLPSKYRVIVENQVEIPKTVSVDNFPPYPKFPKIPKFPDQIDTKEPRWMDKYIQPIVREIQKLRKQKQVADLDGYRSASNPLAVRLSDGKRFYAAISSVVETMSKSAFPFEDSAGNPKAPIVDSGGKLTVDASVSLTECTDFEGGPVTVGTTAVELTFTGTTDSIQIQADHDNTGTIWYGKSNVTNAGANAFGRLEAGEAVQFDLNDASAAVYAVSDAAAQKVYKMALI